MASIFLFYFLLANLFFFPNVALPASANDVLQACRRGTPDKAASGDQSVGGGSGVDLKRNEGSLEDSRIVAEIKDSLVPYREAHANLPRWIWVAPERPDIQPGNIFKSRAFYDYWIQRPGETEALLKRWYGRLLRLPEDYIETVMEEFALSLGESALAALLHPGVYVRWEQFLDFVESKGVRKESFDPFEEIQSFSKDLGNTSVFRAVRWPEPEFKKFSQYISYPMIAVPNRPIPYVADRFLSGERFHKEYLEKLKLLFGFEEGKGGIDSHIFSRLKGSSDSSVFVSVSEHPEVAKAAAWHYSGPFFHKGNLYLFEAPVPVLDTIFPTDQLENLYGSMSRKEFKVDGILYSGVSAELMIPFSFDVDFQLVEVVPDNSPQPKGKWVPMRP
jgi:hypothetical protein